MRNLLSMLDDPDFENYLLTLERSVTVAASASTPNLASPAVDIITDNSNSSVIGCVPATSDNPAILDESNQIINNGLPNLSNEDEDVTMETIADIENLLLMSDGVECESIDDPDFENLLLSLENSEDVITSTPKLASHSVDMIADNSNSSVIGCVPATSDNPAILDESNQIIFNSLPNLSNEDVAIETIGEAKQISTEPLPNLSNVDEASAVETIYISSDDGANETPTEESAISPPKRNKLSADRRQINMRTESEMNEPGTSIRHTDDETDLDNSSNTNRGPNEKPESGIPILIFKRKEDKWTVENKERGIKRPCPTPILRALLRKKN